MCGHPRIGGSHRAWVFVLFSIRFVTECGLEGEKGVSEVSCSV